MSYEFIVVRFQLTEEYFVLPLGLTDKRSKNCNFI